ncbi:MAG: sugar-binding transcriptional regulator [Ktedonobacteraceae bacterium]
MLMSTSPNPPSEGTLLGDDRLLRRIASLYYEEGRTQEEIAAAENYTRQTISKALQKARDRGIIRITVVPEERTGFLRNLSRELRSTFELEDLIIVPGRNMDSLPEEKIDDGVMADIALAAADYLDELLKDGDVLAVSGGKEIMRPVVRYLKPRKRLPKLNVVPTIGFVRPFTNFGDPNLIAHDIALAYGANHAWLSIPAIVETQEQCVLSRSLPLVRDVLKIVESANVVMMGLWPWLSTTDDYLVRRNIVTQKQVDEFKSYKPVADINHWVFDEAGNCINELLKPPPYFLTGLEVPQLKDRIKQGKTKSILVAGASKSYTDGILAILRAGLISILVTDHITAQLLHEKLQ